jgi:hypothetical protein
LQTHTAIIAQSGFGKSFFLGRLVEELMIQTKARCLIFDPNGDFRKVDLIEEPGLWDNATYDPLERRGKLPTETSRKAFEAKWSSVSISIKTGGDVLGEFKKPGEIKLWWPSIAVDFLAEDMEPMYRSKLYHCHALVQAVGFLLALKYSGTQDSTDIIDKAERLIQERRCNVSKEKFRSTLEEEFAFQKLIKYEPWQKGLGFFGRLTWRGLLHARIERSIERAVTASEYVSEDVQQFYFGKARELQSTGILLTKATEAPWVVPGALRTSPSDSPRLEVVDLPSLMENTRLLAVNALLAVEWSKAKGAWSQALEKPAEADERIPIFIVVDEAHNLIPAQPRSRAEAALREQFRTVTAEGRKYGLFLILVTQRPDKLDPFVLSECNNKAILKLGSMSVLKLTRQILGLAGC